jgi:hypothetical protein
MVQANQEQGGHAALATAWHPHAHRLGFYGDDAYLTQLAAEFVRPSLDAGEMTLAILTAEHREQLERLLLDDGVDVAAARAEGILGTPDVEEVVAGLLRDGTPDRAAFALLADGILAEARERRCTVRACGEASPLLRAAGNPSGATALEDLWNELSSQPIELLCLYPMQAFASPESSGAFIELCERHTDVVPTERYPRSPDPREQLRAVAILEQVTGAELAACRALSAQLQHALDSRVLIEQANGVLAERHGLSMQEAFRLLRTHARGTSRSLHLVAAEVISGQLRPG